MKKPASVEAQVVAGQLGKWYGEVCLLNQSYLLNDAATVMVRAVRELPPPASDALAPRRTLSGRCRHGQAPS
jgi:Elongation factor TS